MKDDAEEPPVTPQETPEPPETARTVKKGKFDPEDVGKAVQKAKSKPRDPDDEPPAPPSAPEPVNETFTEQMMRAFPLFG